MWTRIKKFFLRVLIVFLTLLVIGSTALYIHIKNRWKNFISEDEIEHMVQEINNAEEIPVKFLKIYKRTKSIKLERTFNQYILATIFNSPSRYSEPISLDVARRLSPPVQTNSTLASIQYFASLTWQLEKRTTNEKCLNWYLKSFDFVNNQIGIENASRFYFDKELKELGSDEILGLITLLENPVMYNPLRRPELYESRKEELKKTAHNNS